MGYSAAASSIGVLMEPRRRFRFLKELSEGAFGKVYLAEMVTGDNFRSVVAIKLLHGKWLGHDEIVQRSRDEARVLGLLHHRNIIRVEDLTAINGQCAIVMEYLDGVDLKTLTGWCRERGLHIPFRVAFEVTAAVASALEAAYSQTPLQGGEPLHLIHRDIKPSNVMLTKAGDVKVLDFGTAQARFEEREAHTQALAFGSAAYMGPERLLGDPDAPSGDVFSLGVTLYEILCQGAFGKIHIRPEKYDRELGPRLDALPVDDLGPQRAQQIRQVMRLMLAYDGTERPSAGQVVELMEALAEEVNDGTMRRFAREVVAPCREQLEPEPNPDDPLTGSTLFEDRTSGARSASSPETAAALYDSGETYREAEPEVEPDSTWIDDAEHRPFQVPPELAAQDTPREFIDDSFDDDLEERSLGGHAPTSVPPAELEPTPAVVAAPSPPPPPPPSLVTAGSLSPAADREPVVRPPAPKPEASPSPKPKKSGGAGKAVGVVVGLLMVLVIVGGGGAGAAWYLGLLGPSAEEPPLVEEPSTDAAAGAPGGRIEVGPLDGSTGSLTLTLATPGGATVSINSVTGFKQDWDGSGQLELVGLPAGTYKTKVSPAKGPASRGTLEVVAGQTCTYVFPNDKEGGEWIADGCS